MDISRHDRTLERRRREERLSTKVQRGTALKERMGDSERKRQKETMRGGVGRG